MDEALEYLAGNAPRVTREDILSHPRFAEARRLHHDRFLAVYSGDPFMVRLLLESGRFVLFLVVGYLKAVEDPDRPETWLTVKLLKEKMAVFGLASGRHIDELIGRLCAVGYMARQPAVADRRMRILAPTEKLYAHMRDWRMAYFAPLALMFPQHDYSILTRGDAVFEAAYARSCAASLPLSARILASLPDELLFFNRAAGSAVIAALFHAALAADEGPSVALPYGDVGERFGVSRTHVRKILVAAEAAGLVKLHGRGGHSVELLPRLWASRDQGIAAGMYLHDLAYAATVRAIGMA